jgi:hypothetical protein
LRRYEKCGYVRYEEVTSPFGIVFVYLEKHRPWPRARFSIPLHYRIRHGGLVDLAGHLVRRSRGFDIPAFIGVSGAVRRENGRWAEGNFAGMDTKEG